MNDPSSSSSSTNEIQGETFSSTALHHRVISSNTAVDSSLAIYRASSWTEDPQVVQLVSELQEQFSRLEQAWMREQSQYSESAVPPPPAFTVDTSSVSTSTSALRPTLRPSATPSEGNREHTESSYETFMAECLGILDQFSNFSAILQELTQRQQANRETIEQLEHMVAELQLRRQKVRQKETSLPQTILDLERRLERLERMKIKTQVSTSSQYPVDECVGVSQVNSSRQMDSRLGAIQARVEAVEGILRAEQWAHMNALQTMLRNPFEPPQ